MAVRMKALGVKAALVSGRVRDLEEIRGVDLPVWALGKSTVGTAAEAKPGLRNVPVDVGGVVIEPVSLLLLACFTCCKGQKKWLICTGRYHLL